jgi:hypothetical protein
LADAFPRETGQRDPVLAKTQVAEKVGGLERISEASPLVQDDAAPLLLEQIVPQQRLHPL